MTEAGIARRRELPQASAAGSAAGVLRLDTHSLMAYSEDGYLVPKLSRWVTLCLSTPRAATVRVDTSARRYLS